MLGGKGHGQGCIRMLLWSLFAGARGVYRAPVLRPTSSDQLAPTATSYHVPGRRRARVGVFWRVLYTISSVERYEVAWRPCDGVSVFRFSARVYEPNESVVWSEKLSVVMSAQGHALTLES